MKYFFIAFLILLTTNIVAQKLIFVRVYSMSGKLIQKGYIKSLSDSTLELEHNGMSNEIPVSKINNIKTKHSKFHNIFITSIFSMSSLAILAAIKHEPNKTILAWSASEDAALGVIAGIPIGVLIGCSINAFQKTQTFILAGDFLKWKIFNLLSKVN